MNKQDAKPQPTKNQSKRSMTKKEDLNLPCKSRNNHMIKNMKQKRCPTTNCCLLIAHYEKLGLGNGFD